MLVRITNNICISVLEWVACFLLMYALKVCNVFLFGISLVLAGGPLIAIFLEEFIKFQKIQKSDEVKKLRDYASNKCPRAKLCVKDDEDSFQGTAIGKKRIIISERWYRHIQEVPEHIEYVYAIICHEIYHLSQKHNALTRMYKSNCPVRKVKDEYLIKCWLEELNADREGCKLYGDKNVFIEKMEFMKKHGYKPKEGKRTVHPSWEMRIEYIQNDIIPTQENVTERYQKRYHLGPFARKK